jgi:hypothetical protein
LVTSSLLGSAIGGALDHLQHARLARRHEQDGHAGAAGAAGAADAVHVGLGVVGDVVVDDVADARHVDAARGDVGGDHDVEGAVLQLLDHALAQALGHVAVERRGANSRALPACRRAPRWRSWCARRRWRRRNFLDLEDAGQRVELVHAGTCQ